MSSRRVQANKDIRELLRLLVKALAETNGLSEEEAKRLMKTKIKIDRKKQRAEREIGCKLRSIRRRALRNSKVAIS
jgi:hypothetical protein